MDKIQQNHHHFHHHHPHRNEKDLKFTWAISAFLEAKRRNVLSCDDLLEFKIP